MRVILRAKVREDAVVLHPLLSAPFQCVSYPLDGHRTIQKGMLTLVCSVFANMFLGVTWIKPSYPLVMTGRSRPQSCIK